VLKGLGFRVYISRFRIGVMIQGVGFGFGI